EKNIVLTERRRSAEKGDEPTVYRLNVRTTARGEETTPPVGEKLHQGGGGEIPPGPWGRNYATQETEKGQTGFDHSNLRRAERGSVDNSVQSVTTATARNGGPPRSPAGWTADEADERRRPSDRSRRAQNERASLNATGMTVVGQVLERRVLAGTVPTAGV